MPSHARTYGDEYGPVGHILVNTGHLQKGGGLGGILTGWTRRAIPIVKEKGKALLKDLGIQALDSVYEVARNKLVSIKDPPKVTKLTLQTPAKSQPKKDIKRKASTTSFSRNRSVKRKRPRKNSSKLTKNNKTGFRKVTL